MRSGVEHPRDGRAIRIGIDGRALAVAPSGIGRYISELCRILDRQLPCASFFIYSNRPIRMPVESNRWTARIDRSVGVKYLHPLIWLMLRGHALCALDQIDVFWGAMTVVPRLPASTKAVVTVYDLFHMERRVVSLRRWLSYGFLYKRSLDYADAIMAISQTTARNVHRFFGYEVAAVVKPGTSVCYRPRPADEVEECLRLLGIRSPYIFTVASRYEPRKNLRSLVEAFCSLKADGVLRDHILLLAGAGGGHAIADSPFARAAESGVIRSLGEIREDDLALLYCGADAFVFPSTHEGFGIPVAEARACGTKIVATDIPELHEAGNDDAIYVAPTVEGIRNGIVLAVGRKMKGAVAPYSDTWQQSGAILARILLGRDSTN